MGLRALIGSLRGRDERAGESLVDARSPPTANGEPDPDPRPTSGPLSASNPPAEALRPSPEPSPPVTVSTAPDPLVRAVRTASVGDDTLRLSQRVVLHVYRQGALGPYEVAPVELCQLGIVRSLGVRQSALTKVLTRLVAAGVLSTDRRHVEAQPRRLKVYQLTPLGESLARDLRRTFPTQFMTERSATTMPPAPSRR